MNNAKRNFADFYWPDIENLDAAKKAAQLGAGAGFFCAGITLIVMLVEISGVFGQPLFGMNGWATLDILVIAGLAYGTLRFSRSASVLSLALYIFEQGVTLSETHETNYFMVVLMTMMFVNGIRGCFAYHQFKNDPQPPSRAQYPESNVNPNFQSFGENIRSTDEIQADLQKLNKGNRNAS